MSDDRSPYTLHVPRYNYLFSRTSMIACIYLFREVQSATLPSPQPSTRLRNVKKEFDQLEEQFHDLKKATLAELTKKSRRNKGLFRLFQTRLALLRASLTKRHERYFSAVNLARVLRSQSFEEIFAMLDDYWSVLNCSLLLHIITKFTQDDPVQALAESFRSSLKVFRTNTRLSQLKEMHGIHVHPEFTKVTMLSQQPEWETYTLENVQTVKEALTLKASLQPFALQLVSASPGSVVLTWALPEHLAPLLAHSLDDYLPEHLVPLFADSLDDSLQQKLGINTVEIRGVPLEAFVEQNPLTNIQMEVGYDCMFTIFLWVLLN